MNLANKCRACLSDDKLMYDISGSVIQEMWEKLTNARFISNDGKPVIICYICCVQLKKSVQMMKRALKAEELLTDFINKSSCQPLNLVSAEASLLKHLNYNYVARPLYCLEINQIQRNAIVKIKEEKTENFVEMYEEDNDQFNMVINEEEDMGNQELNEDYEGANSQEDIDIKVEEYVGSIQEESQEILNTEPSSHYSNETKNILEQVTRKELRIVLERIDQDVLAMTPKDKDLLLNTNQNNVYSVKCARKSLNNALNTSLPNEGSRGLEETMPGKVITNKAYIMSESISENSKPITNVENPKQNEMSIGKVNIIDSGSRAGEFFRTNVESPDLFKSLNNRNSGNKVDKSFDAINEKLETNLSGHVEEIVGKSNLNEQSPKHAIDKPYKCHLCDYRSSVKKYVVKHVKGVHEKVKPFSCHVCSRKFIRRSQLNTHLHTHTGNKPYKCDLCDYRTIRTLYLIHHIQAIHTNERNFPCPKCEHKAVTKAQLKAHLLTHTVEKRFICDLCGYGTSWKYDLKNHIQAIHTNDRNFPCPKCEHKAVTKAHLKVHLVKHTLEKPYICDLCGYRSSWKYELSKHIKSVHNKTGRTSPRRKLYVKKTLNKCTDTKKKPFQCDLCDYRCPGKVHLSDHIKAIHTNERNFLCHMCDHRSVTNRNLQLHLLSHTGDKPNKCDLCDYKASTKTLLTRHVKQIHTKERDFSCDMCQRKFVRKDNLNNHLRTHTKEKPFICNLCDFRTAQKPGLNLHIKAIHKKQKDFSCHMCIRKFVDNQGLKKHLRVHSRK